MGWFKNLFIRKDSQAESIPAPIKRKPDISEPVISFVETFKANPQRFKVVRLSCRVESLTAVFTYRLEDKHNKLSWNFNISRSMGMTFGVYTTYIGGRPSFLTMDEANFIYEALTPWFEARKDRFKKLKLDKQREALKKVYCK